MLRLPSLVLIGFTLFAGSAVAQIGPEPASPPQGEGIDAVVLGLSINDMLNVRAEASPMSRTLGRLANGSLVRQYQCEAVNGYDWCRVDAVEEDVKGWAPGRYLQPLNVDEVLQPQREEAVTTELPPIDSIMGELPPPPAQAGPPVPTPAPRGVEVAVPQEEAVRPAVDPQASEKGSRLLADDPDELPDGIEARFAEGASVPLEKVRAPDGTKGAGPQLTGEVPCARYVGEPMKSCVARIARQGPDGADVTVVWPDGGSRIITFRDGVPAGSNSRESFRFTREGSLNMIRVGTSERFEILDAHALDE
jgi:hypothetical protein